MKKLILLLHFTFSILNFTFSQTAPGIEWQNTIGGSSNDWLYCVNQTSDNGYIIGGKSISNISGDKSENCFSSFWDYWVVKIDSLGNKQWDNTYGGSGDDQLSSISQTTDGGYIIGGSSNSNISGDKTGNCFGYPDYWVLKTDSAGSIQWQKTIGGNSGEELSCINQTGDGGYILGGWSSSNISGNKTENTQGTTDYWIVKLDATGNIMWQNDIGGSLYDYLSFVQQTTDGGYILGGNSDSYMSGDKLENRIENTDYWIVKTDSAGVIQWQNTIGGYNDDFLRELKQTSDGGFILGGSSNSLIGADKSENSSGFDFWVVKVDSAGNIQWENTIAGNNYDDLYSMIPTSDGGYICGGYSNSNISGDKTENNCDTINAGDYWIIKLDSTGFINWQLALGGSQGEALYSIKQTLDNGYIAGGVSTSDVSCFKNENCMGGLDYWIVKLYPDTTTGIPTLQPSTNNIQLYPNPTKDEITITGYTMQNNQPAQLRIFDVMGKQVLSQSITNLNSHILNLRSFIPGVYYLQWNNGKQMSTARFVKM